MVIKFSVSRQRASIISLANFRKNGQTRIYSLSENGSILYKRHSTALNGTNTYITKETDSLEVGLQYKTQRGGGKADGEVQTAGCEDLNKTSNDADRLGAPRLIIQPCRLNQAHQRSCAHRASSSRHVQVRGTCADRTHPASR